jgi:hypothetical protein
MTQSRGNLNLKFINILDPCLSSNNLGKSISLFNAHRLRESLKLQAARMQELRAGDVLQGAYFERLVEVFKFTLEMCAVLPPLSINLP